MRKSTVWFMFLVLLFSGAAIGYSTWLGNSGSHIHQSSPEPLALLPDYVQKAEANVQTAYQFARDHPELLGKLPCYCGCEKSLDHQHNLDCYISTFNAEGSVAKYDSHAAYCGVCLDITLIARDMLAERKSTGEIHSAIDVKYGYAEPHIHTYEIQSAS